MARAAGLEPTLAFSVPSFGEKYFSFKLYSYNPAYTGANDKIQTCAEE